MKLELIRHLAIDCCKTNVLPRNEKQPQILRLRPAFHPTDEDLSVGTPASTDSAQDDKEDIT
jgi:hypothetical protein